MISDTSQPVSPPVPTVSEKARELFEKAVRSTWSGIEARPTPDESALLSYIAELEAIRIAAEAVIDGYNSAQNKSRQYTIASLREALNRFPALPADSAMESK
jgi:hypothetical protein